MPIVRENSHVVGAKNLITYGLNKIEITDPGVSQLDVTGSFTIAWQMQLFGFPVTVPLDYIIFSKGHPTSAATGSISCESVNGYMRVWLHDDDGIRSLVLTSANPVLNSSQNMHYAIVWDFSLKTLTVYKDGIQIPMNVTTGLAGITHWTAQSQMTLINTNNSPFTWFNGTGKNNFVGKLKPSVIMSNTAWTSNQIYNLFLSVKYDPNIHGAYPTLGKIVFSRYLTTVSRHQVFTMNEDGTDQQQINSNPYDCYYPKWSPDGNKIAFGHSDFSLYTNTGASNSIFTMDKDGANLNTSFVAQPYTAYPSWTTDGNLIYGGWPPGTQVQRLNPITNTIISTYTTPNPPFDSGGTNDWVDFLPGSSFFVLRQSGNGYLYKVNINPSTYAYVSHSIIDYLPESTSNAYNIRNPRISPDGTKVVYSKRISHAAPNNFFNIFIADVTGGNVTQLTGATTYHCLANGFSPDGTKILFADNLHGVYQLKTMNINGTNIVRISNNSFDEPMAHWKA